MKKNLTFLVFVCLAAAFSANAQTTNKQKLIAELLDLPAPPAVIPTKETAAKERPDKFFSNKNIPPDDAPLEDLLDFWKKKSADHDEFQYNPQPSKKSLERILETLKDNPDDIPQFINVLPSEPDAAELVKNFYQKQLQDNPSAIYNFENVKNWLKRNTDLFVNELIKSVEAVKAEDDRLTNQEDFESLAIVDWDRAKPFVDRFESNRGDAETFTLAKYVLYHRALKEGNTSDIERYRDELKKLVEDKSLSYKSRDLAMDALVLGGDFEGRAEWYLSLLKDETLLELQENNFTGLSTLPNHSSNKREDWLPAMKRIIETGTPSERTAAIRNLVVIRDDDDEEILRMLLPWLEDANWAKESDDERKELVEALKSVKIPEAVPGLIAVISKEKGGIRASAAETIGEYDAPQAIPVLRAALREKNDEEEYEEEDSRAKFVQALLKLKGFSADEQMSFLEAFAVYTVKQKKAAESGKEDYSEVTPLEVFIGNFLKRQEEPDEILVQRVIDRIKILSRTNPLVAGELSAILNGWKSRLIDLERLNSVKNGTVDVSIVLRLLADRRELKERISSELFALRTIDGLPRGLFAAVTEDQSEFFTILKQSDDDTRMFALAGARLLRLPIPIGDVAPFLASQNKMLALAAERYLESEDSLEARKLILAKYPNEVRILGARRMFKPVEEKDFQSYDEVLTLLFKSVNETQYMISNESEMIKYEKTLRDEVKQNPDLQTVFALVPNNSVGQKVVRVFKDKIVFTFYEDEARYRQRELSREEFKAFFRFLVDSQIDTYIPPGESKINYLPGEFLMFSRNGGRRVAIQPLESVLKLSPFDNLFKVFDEFARRDLKIHYKLSDKLNGLEILSADDKFTARAVWKNGDDFRVLVEDEEKKKLIQEEIETAEKIENSDFNADREQLREIRLRRRSQSLYKHFSWRKVTGNKISDVETAQPSEIFYLGSPQFSGQYALPDDPAPNNRNRISGGFEYRTDGDYIGDILKSDASGAQSTVKKGNYRNPIVSADGKWLVANKRAEEGADKLVLINLLSGRETPINSIPTADILQAQTFAASSGKFVIVRARYPYSNGKENPDAKTPEFYLFDPNSGLAQPTKAELRPLLQQTYRSLQPTGNPSEFWAAIYDEKNKSTQIGRYNDKTLTFKTILEIPEIALGSVDFWIDERAAKIYFVYQKQLLSLPLAIKSEP